MPEAQRLRLVTAQRQIGNLVPGEGGLRGCPAVPPHPSGPFKMVPDAVNPVDAVPAIAEPCKNVNVMSLPLERGCQLSDMRGDAPHRD